MTQYKINYLNFQIGGNTTKNILIVGYAGAGKSFLSKKYKTKNYIVIDADETIRELLLKNKSDLRGFDIYQSSIPDNLLPFKNEFIEFVRNKTQNEKFVVEGQLKNVTMIKELFGDEQNFNIIVVQPKNEKSYIKNIKLCFKNDPANYGRLGFLENADDKNNRQALNDYIKNGFNGKIIDQLINDGAKSRYFKHAELEEYYKNNFKNVIIKKN